MGLILILRVGRSALATGLAVAMVALGAAACSRSATAIAPDSVSVVASFYPLAEAAVEVGGDHVRVTNLTAPGVEPHDLELTPRQLEAITTADVVLYLGGGFQPAVEDAIGDAQGRTVDVSAGLRTLPPPAGEGSDPGLSADPHVWLDPVLYGQIVGIVEAALAAASPGDASTFAANAAAFRAKVGSLDRAYRTGLATCARDVIVTSHAAFGYLSQRYGLRQEAISGLSPDAEPSPQHLADLATLVERDGVTTIFTESLVSPKVAQTLAQETGATTAVLNPLESLTGEEMSAGDDYVSVMRDNLTELRTALGCS
jgi:zinc transport system substrate-binding protein